MSEGRAGDGETTAEGDVHDHDEGGRADERGGTRGRVGFKGRRTTRRDASLQLCGFYKTEKTVVPLGGKNDGGKL